MGQLTRGKGLVGRILKLEASKMHPERKRDGQVFGRASADISAGFKLADHVFYSTV